VITDRDVNGSEVVDIAHVKLDKRVAAKVFLMSKDPSHMQRDMRLRREEAVCLDTGNETFVCALALRAG